jgi:catechol 2,3-dioxygenase-like lactoylglutathione lyase family enzyme
MIDHVSIEVADLKQATEFYERVLATIGYNTLIEKPGTAGFGKKYPDSRLTNWNFER